MELLTDDLTPARVSHPRQPAPPVRHPRNGIGRTECRVTAPRRVDGPDSTFWPLTGTLTLFGIGTLLQLLAQLLGPAHREAEFFAHLLFDLVIFTAVLYFSGGATNPLVSYYLVPIAIAAATLPRRLTWAITLLSLAAYTLLMQVYVPLEPLSPHTTHHQEPHTWFDLHILGMWLNFAVSAGFITYFVVRMVEAVRERDARIQRHLDEERRIEQVLSIASLAAGTAHELGTLSTASRSWPTSFTSNWMIAKSCAPN